MTRLEANRKILALLSIIIEKYPDLRMGQIIPDLPFYEESTDTLETLLNQADWFATLPE
jgi:hypothetical protein